MSSNFARYLSQHKSDQAYLEILPGGNNGDELIRKGFEHVLAKSGCRRVMDPDKADRIVIRGCGDMNDVYGLKGALGALLRIRSSFPETPLVVGPSTFRFRGIDLNSLLNRGRASVMLFARDYRSWQYARACPLSSNVNVRLSDDLAFELADSSLIAELRGGCRATHVLVAMRKDRESASAGLLSRTRGDWLPKAIRTPLSKLRDRAVAYQSREHLRPLIQDKEIQQLPIIYRDISVSVSFERFLTIIRDAALIITDRLHVGILGHLINKRVHLLTSTDFHKVQGVYDLSMSELNSNTSLVITQK